MPGAPPVVHMRPPSPRTASGQPPTDRAGDSSGLPGTAVLHVLEAEAALDAEVAGGHGWSWGEVTFTIRLSCTCSVSVQPTPQ